MVGEARAYLGIEICGGVVVVVVVFLVDFFEGLGTCNINFHYVVFYDGNALDLSQLLHTSNPWSLAFSCIFPS